MRKKSSSKKRSAKPRQAQRARSKSDVAKSTKANSVRGRRTEARRSKARKSKAKKTSNRRREFVEQDSVLDGRIAPALSGRQSGDFQGVRSSGNADSESVDELLEKGNAFEAGVVEGVEEADDDQLREVHTREVPEDDVPDEYLDKD